MKILLLCALFGSVNAFAVPSLFPAFQGARALTLPRGRFLVSYTRISVAIDSRFDPSGEVGSIGAELSRDLTWKDVIAGRPERSDQIAGLLDAHGISEQDSAGYFEGDLVGRLNLTVPVAGFGITDQLGIFVAVPIQNIRVRSKVSYQRSLSAEKLVNELGGTDQQAAANDMAATLNDGFSDQIAKAGYRYQEHVEQTKMGDVRVEIPYVFKKRFLRSRASFALIGSVVLPTGSRPDPADLIPLSSGQGRLVAGLRGVASHDLTSRLRLHFSSGLMLPLPADRSVRVPRDENDRLSSDIDTRARISGGVTALAELHAQVLLTRSWILSSGLQHQSKTSENFKGSEFTESRYSFLSARTAERLESYFVNLELNTLSAFLAGDFKFPIQVTGGYAAPIAGVNSLGESYAFIQSTLFF